MRAVRSVVSIAKCSLFLLNLWVLAVVLVVILGHWRVFDGDDHRRRFDASHLVVMRELKEDGDGQVGVAAKNISKIIPVPTPPRHLELDPFTEERTDRVKTLHHWCQKLRPKLPDLAKISPDKFHQILVDDKYKLLYCQIPGVAQTDWRRILVFLSGKVNLPHHLKISGSDVHSKYSKHLKKLSDLPPLERKRRISQYYKVIFVREPMERLVATFQSKFAAKHSKYFHQMFGKKIIKRYREKPSKASLQKGSDVTFPEFVQFLVDSEHQFDEPLNEHWEQYYKQCHPCLIQYDFVGKLETLNDDAKYVLEKTSAIQKIKPPIMSNNFTYPENVLRTLYKPVSASNLRRLWKIYYPDYNLFSYPYPDLLEELLKSAKFYHDY